MKQTSSSSHWNVSCSCHDIAEILINWRYTISTRSLNRGWLYFYFYFSMKNKYFGFIFEYQQIIVSQFIKISRGLVIIKLVSKSFVLPQEKKQPIRMSYLINTVFWLKDVLVQGQNSYSCLFWTWSQHYLQWSSGMQKIVCYSNSG